MTAKNGRVNGREYWPTNLRGAVIEVVDLRVAVGEQRTEEAERQLGWAWRREPADISGPAGASWWGP